jgi:hypothetical protein
MAKARRSQFGGLKPKYNFIVNPYPDMRISRCPFCEKKTGQRKLPLLIHIDPLHMVALNYTCRYCQDCDLLIAHKHEVERLLTDLFLRADPEAIGNDYLILGTVEKKAWREGMEQSKPVNEMLPHVSQFVEYYKELCMTQPGWFPANKEPPVMEPPESQDWVKSRSKHRRGWTGR